MKRRIVKITGAVVFVAAIAAYYLCGLDYRLVLGGALVGASLIYWS